MKAITTLTPYLWIARSNAKNLFPIVIKVSVKKGGHDYIRLKDVAVNQDYWDEVSGRVIKKHPQASELNEKISETEDQLKELLNNLTFHKIVTDAKGIKKMFEQGNMLSKSNLLHFIDARIKESANKVAEGTLSEYKRYRNIVLRFHNRKKKDVNRYTDDLYFENINRDWLVDLEAWLCEKFRPYSVYIFWSNLSGLFKKAVDLGVIKSNPFVSYQKPTGEPAEKEYFTMDHINILEQVADYPFTIDIFQEKKIEDYRVQIYQETAKWLLFGCHFGLRISDWRQFDRNKHIKDGELRIRAIKNGGHVSIELKGSFERACQRVMNEIPPDYATMRDRIFKLIDALGWEMHFTPHCTRKTFATTFCASMGISCEDCAEYLGITPAQCKKSYYRVTNEMLHQRARILWKDLQGKEYTSKLRVA